jgi:hypothetical protein
MFGVDGGWCEWWLAWMVVGVVVGWCVWCLTCTLYVWQVILHLGMEQNPLS